MRKQLLILVAWLCCWTIGIDVRADDVAPPQVSAFSLTPAEIDTEDADQLVTLSVTLTDDISGVCISGDCGDSYVGSPCQARLVSTSGNSQFVDFWDLIRESGTSLDGAYSATAILPKGSASGSWQIEYLFLSDRLGNMVSLYKNDLDNLFGSGATEISNNAANSDTTPPELLSFLLSPSEIDTSSTGQELTLSVTIRDDIAGVCIEGDCGSGNFGFPSSLRIKPASGATQFIDFINFSRETGDSLYATYSSTVAVPTASASGIWQVDYFQLGDQLGNTTSRYQQEIESQFGVESSRITNTAVIDDTAPPQVTSFTLTPETFDSSVDEQIVTLTIAIEDDLSGICISGDCRHNNSPTQLRIMPLIGTQMTDFWDFHLQSGDNLNGTYTASATIPVQAKEGIWEVQYLYLVDNLGNGVSLSIDDLNNQFGGDHLTIANTAESYVVEVERNWTFSSAVASVTFDTETTVTRDNDGSFAFYRMVNQESDISELPTTPPDGNTIKTLKFGIPSLGLSFNKPLHITIVVGEELNGEQLRILSLGETEDIWTEETTCTVMLGHCSFDVTHASYFSSVLGRYGDVNNNSLVELNDAILALQVTAGRETTEAVVSSADVNNDKKIGLPEAIYILRDVGGIH